MNISYVFLILKILLTVCIYVAIYNIVKDNFHKVDERFDNLIGSISKRYSEKIARRNEKKYIKVGRETFADRLESIILSSRIREAIPFFSVEILILISLFTGVAFTIVAVIINPRNIAIIIESMILGVALPVLILQEMSIRIFNKIDKDLDTFTIKGITHSKSKSTLIVILIKCEEYLTGPIKPILSNLINDLNRGAQKEVAFNNAVERVENIRVKQLLINLLISSQNEGNYKKVFEDAESANKDYFELRDMAEDKIREGKSSVAGLVIATIVAVIALKRQFPNMTSVLNDTVAGQIIIAYFGAIIIFLIYKFFSFSKINY